MAERRNWSQAIYAKKIVKRGSIPCSDIGPNAPFRDSKKLYETVIPRSGITKPRIRSEIKKLRILVGASEMRNLVNTLNRSLEILIKSGDYRPLAHAYSLIPQCEQRDQIISLIEATLGVSVDKNAPNRLMFVAGQKRKHKSKIRIDLLKKKIELLCGERA